MVGTFGQSVDGTCRRLDMLRIMALIRIGSAQGPFDDPALDASPTPDCEWAGVSGVLGGEVLASLLGISSSSVRRYLSGSRATPDGIAARLHFLALVIGDLAGAYHDFGVRRWFQRPRRLLGSRSPAQLLDGTWQPEDPGPQRVRDLAAALVSSPSM